MSSTGKIVPELDDLFYKFTELLTGEATEENMEYVRVWALYSHISKVMPPLIQHWSAEPGSEQARAKIKEVFEAVQRLNQENKEKIRAQQTRHLNNKKQGAAQ